MSEDRASGGESVDLGDRLDDIEQSPLATRAAAYAEVQEQLRVRLEGGDAR
ncbi:hypothetical protein [Rathayibacter sp. VKM Ac-2857]|uniref:hypothetical protein n=1 Tax=Rathayibacter sp. VKM Ac-2857 TaxID=2739020 RepID=UPI001565C6B8|nr:hypothetical protein [Rathayibacter sp. VKM Ac-2857]NQX17569.1 hypothetical protein [Rathayibacter sp. VKM Ac-2857]